MGIEVQFDELMAASTALQKISVALDRTELRRVSLLALKDFARLNFYDWMDAYAASRGEKLGHVYEWGKIGEPGGRLFEMIYTQSNAYAGESSIKFLDSQTVVPIEDPLKREHIFKEKAAVEEQGMQVEIAVINAKFLAWYENGVLKKDPGPITVTLNQHQGEFASAWNNYWRSVGEKHAIRAIEEPFDKFMQKHGIPYIEKAVKKAKSKRTKGALATLSVKVSAREMPLPNFDISPLRRNLRNG